MILRHLKRKANMKTAVDSPSIDRTSHGVFIPEDRKEFAEWCLNNKVDGVTTPIYEFKQQLKSLTNVQGFNIMDYITPIQILKSGV